MIDFKALEKFNVRRPWNSPCYRLFHNQPIRLSSMNPFRLGAMSFAVLIGLSGCSIQEVASTAADAAACKALSSTLTGLSEAYESGLVDSGIIQQIESLIGDQVDFLLSTELAADIGQLAKELASTDPAETTAESIEELTASIAQRCQIVGVEFSE